MSDIAVRAANSALPATTSVRKKVAVVMATMVMALSLLPWVATIVTPMLVDWVLDAVRYAMWALAGHTLFRGWLPKK